jgi:hypothetical protein
VEFGSVGGPAFLQQAVRSRWLGLSVWTRLPRRRSQQAPAEKPARSRRTRSKATPATEAEAPSAPRKKASRPRTRKAAE